MGENPAEIAHKFGGQKKGLMLTAAQPAVPPSPSLFERGGGVVSPAYDVYPTASISPHKLLTRIPVVHVVYYHLSLGRFCVRVSFRCPLHVVRL